MREIIGHSESHVHAIASRQMTAGSEPPFEHLPPHSISLLGLGDGAKATQLPQRARPL
jgi:hypothetical protein